MATPYHHAVSSVRKWGGEVEDYLLIHEWFDALKAQVGDFRHRAVRHHAEGVAECERIFGVTITVYQRDTNGKVKISTATKIPVRWIAERHVIEDCGYIPVLADWLRAIKPSRWMQRNTQILDDGNPVEDNHDNEASS